MQRLRRHWLALFGAILLLTLTVSSAFGAPPEGNRGQTIAAFVHQLIDGDDGADEDQDEDEADEEDADEEDADEDTDEADDEDVEESEDEDTDVDADAAARQVPEEFANHGECVSDAAHDNEGFDESDASNKGEWVSDHARFICWGLDVPGADDEEEAATDEAADTDADEATDADELSAKEQAAADRAAARAERRAAREAARAEREAARAEGVSQSNSRGGNGKGKGGGRP